MNSNQFLNTNLIQTNINDGYKYETHSEFIKNLKPTVFSVYCIFCSFDKTNPLTSDGSFRACLRCRKHFKAKIVTN